MNEIAIPMFDRGDHVKDKFGNIFKIITALAPQHFERDSFEYDEMGYQLELIEKARIPELAKLGMMRYFTAKEMNIGFITPKRTSEMEAMRLLQKLSSLQN